MICFCSPGLQLDFDMVRTNRLPAMRDRIGRLACFHSLGRIPAAIRAEEGFALGIEASQFFGAGKIGKVVAAFAIFGLVIDHFVHDFDLPDRSSCAGSWSRRPSRPTG